MSNRVYISAQTLPHSIEAEHSVLGALLLDNEAIYRIANLRATHFYEFDNGKVFAEVSKQIAAGSRCDVLTVFDVLQNEIADCLPYLNSLVNRSPGSANIERHTFIVIEKARKRALIALGDEIASSARGNEGADVLIDSAASKLELLMRKAGKQEPALIADMLTNYIDIVQARMDGKIMPIQTGFKDLDNCLDGGLERGTLTVIAARPSMGKTAMGLCLARNVAERGAALFLSMEMSRDQVNDRNIAALGKLPVTWLKHPSDKSPSDKDIVDCMTHALECASNLNLYIDDQTALTMLAIRSKARSVKRKNGLDLLVIDQLSFISGSTEDNKAYAIGEYTRGLVQLSKELDIAVVLLCQLNRDLERRTDRRPIMADLAMSGSIEQDAANIIFLYRDAVYNPDAKDKEICEVIIAKQRQGELGVVGLSYIGEQTRFENLPYTWQRKKEVQRPRSARGFNQFSTEQSLQEHGHAT